MENLSGADVDGATFPNLQRDLQRDVQSLREKYDQRAAIIKKLKKRVRNEGTTTAVESSSDTQNESEANQQTRAIENCKSYLSKGAGAVGTAQEARGDLTPPERAKNRWSDTETDEVEEVKTPLVTEEEEVTEPKNVEREYFTNHENFVREVLERNHTPESDHDMSGGNRDGPFSPPSPFEDWEEEKL